MGFLVCSESKNGIILAVAYVSKETNIFSCPHAAVIRLLRQGQVITNAPGRTAFFNWATSDHLMASAWVAGHYDIHSVTVIITIEPGFQTVEFFWGFFFFNNWTFYSM